MPEASLRLSFSLFEPGAIAMHEMHRGVERFWSGVWGGGGLWGVLPSG